MPPFAGFWGCPPDTIRGGWVGKASMDEAWFPKTLEHISNGPGKPYYAKVSGENLLIATNKFWIGFAISILLMVLFLVTVDLDRMVDELADANYLFVVPGIGMYLVSILFRTLRWQVLLRHMRPIRVRRLYPVVVVGYMANNLLPMRLGELVRSYYVGEREGISKTSALATIVVERVLDALTLLFFISAIALFVPLAGLAEAFGDSWGVPWPLLVVAFTVPFVVAFGTLLRIAFFPARSAAVAMALIRPLPQRFEAPLRGLIDLFLKGLIPLRSPRTLALLLLMSVPIWLFEAGLFFLVGFSFGLDSVFDNLGEMAVAAVLVTAIANIGSSIPAAPGGIGLFELITTEILVVLPLASVDPAVAGAFALVTHAALLLPMIFLGQVFLWAGHISLRRLSKADALPQTPTGDSDPRSQDLTPATLSTERDESE